MDHLADERTNCPFDIGQMSEVVWNGRDRVERVKRLSAIVANDPLFARVDFSSLTRAQAMKISLGKATHMYKRVNELQLADEDKSIFKLFVDDISFYDLHHYMFIPALEGQATPQQSLHWLPRARRLEWIGCYAQTELGHGSNVQGLETTATWVEGTDAFEMHTPTVTATKWWPGGLGKASNHAVVYARLITKGEDKGVHAFLVPIRCQRTHLPLPGVSVGDIGPKFGNGGYNTMDNGFLAFDRVRIPRTNMLMRFASVSRDGTYSRASSSSRQLLYGAMVFIRKGLVMESAVAMARAVTIAVRYSCVRRQFGGEGEGKPENKVIDYQTQQMRLLPLLSSVFAFLACAQWMEALYADVMQGISRGDVSSLPEVHAATAGLKALTTSVAVDGIEECRKLCGGHGYSLFSGLPQLYASFLPACTYEGDNTVMQLQVARYLLRAVHQASQSQVPSGTAAYLGDEGNRGGRCEAEEESAFLDTSLLLRALQSAACHKVVAAATAVAAAPTLEKGFLSNSVPLTSASMAHCRLIAATKFVEHVSALKRDGRASGGVAEAMDLMCHVYVLHTVDQSAADLLACEFFAPHHPALAKQQLLLLLPKLRDIAVPLVDSFLFTDHFLNSSLGRFDGDVYTDLVRRAKADPVNVPPVVDGYEEFLRPLTTRQPASRL